VSGPETLVILSSHSGNTEETLSGYKAARQRNCRCLAVATGGKLAQMAAEDQTTTWKFNHQGQPRAAVGYSFGLLLAALARLGLLPDPQEELSEAIEAMLAAQKNLEIKTTTNQNPAKRLAGQLVGRWVTVMGSDYLQPVARRWKGQISEIAKAWGQFEFLPEANHNTLAGILNPEELLSKTMVLFLRAPTNHNRNQLRSELTRRILMLEGFGTDFVHSTGKTPLANMWTCLHFGDYVSYYLAMAYGVDPTPVDAIEGFKREMAEA
jgi:glucose/mannose-6-phosphate isomerase